MRTGDVGLLLGLGLDFLLLGLVLELGALEGDATHNGHGHLLVANVSSLHYDLIYQ